MAYLTDLNWWVPECVWENYLDHIEEKWDDTTVYAGVFASSAMREYMDSDGFAEAETAIVSDLQTDSPAHTHRKKELQTPLNEEKKCKVRNGVHPPTKEAFAAYARKNDEYPGVMFAYALREYLNGGRIGRIEEIKSRDAKDEPESTEKIPYGESEKADWIAEQVEADGPVHADDIRPVIEEAGAASRVDHYRPLVLDRLGYVHHPNAENLYIARADLEEQFGISPGDAPFYRKPWGALDRCERIEGLKKELIRLDSPLTVSEIHDKIFGGEGSRNYIRDLANTVAESDEFAYGKSVGGTKRLRFAGSRSRSHSRSRSDPEGESEPEQRQEPTADNSEQEQERGREEIETEAADEMAALMNASPETDGGRAATDGGRDQSP